MCMNDKRGRTALDAFCLFYLFRQFFNQFYILFFKIPSQNQRERPQWRLLSQKREKPSSAKQKPMKIAEGKGKSVLQVFYYVIKYVSSTEES